MESDQKSDRPLRRRTFLAAAAAGVLGLARAASPGALLARATRRGGDARLHARPGTVSEPAPPGLHQLAPTLERGALLYLPASFRAGVPGTLMIMLHGYRQRAAPFVEKLRPAADEKGFAILAPDSRGDTWDAAQGDFGPDVAFLDAMLAATFRRCPIAPDRVVLAGFSDGASYALSLGIVNGDLATRVVAYSPGFLLPGDQNGVPAFFISHGTRDPVLPIDTTSRRIVSRLLDAGYPVEFREFDGGHEMPPKIVDASIRWFLAAR